MSDIISARPDIGAQEIAMDAWTQPFWQAAEQGKLLLPGCGDCGRFRWPPGPFCPHCQSQHTVWRGPGPARLYSYTLVRPSGEPDGPWLAPGLVEFPEADGVRLLAAVVDTPLAAIRIGAAMETDWSRAANASLPVFRVVPGPPG